MSLAEQFIVQAGVISAPPRPARPSVVEIQRTVAAFYAIDPASMKSASHAFDVAHPRQVAMYLAKKLTPNSLPAIGRHFGNRHHTTVLHGIRQVERRFADPDNDAGSDVRAICTALADVVDSRSIPEDRQVADRLEMGRNPQVSPRDECFPQDGTSSAPESGGV